MQNSSTYYSATQCQGINHVWTKRMRMDRENNSSWDSSLAGSFAESDHSPYTPARSHEDAPLPLEYTWTPPTPTLDSDQSSSLVSTIELDELPEIPFVSTPPTIYESPFTDDDDDYISTGNVSERAFWSSLIRPSHSRSSSDPPFAVLGQTTHRVVHPKRRRSPSVSSNASSRSKPAPAKSILSSSSSIRTRKGGSPPSVKFLDMPTIHYEEWDYDDDEEEFDFDADQNFPPRTTGPSDKKSSGVKFGFGFIRRLFNSSSTSTSNRGKISPPPPPSPKKQARSSESRRPNISGPYPLWEAPRPARRSLDGQSDHSIRSVRSNGSMRSIRSCESRMQTYWGRFGAKDP